MEIRRPYDRLISTKGFHILVRWHLYIESGPRCHNNIFWSVGFMGKKSDRRIQYTYLISFFTSFITWFIRVSGLWARNVIIENTTPTWCHKLIYRSVEFMSKKSDNHYCDVIMNAMAYKITRLTIVYSTVYSGPEENIKAPRRWPLCGN